MREIDGKAKTIHLLLSNAKYSIDYYQRDYKWGQKQVQELIDDLTQSFLDDYKIGHERSDVENYGHYFLGSIIISEKKNRKFIIDGQQRLTTLTLLLIFLNNRQRNLDKQVSITDLIFSEKFDRKSFNLEVEERVACMEALFYQQPIDQNGSPESVKNILARYADIESNFPEEINDKALPYFLDWLLENVHFVEITSNKYLAELEPHFPVSFRSLNDLMKQIQRRNLTLERFAEMIWNTPFNPEIKPEMQLISQDL